MEIKIKNTKDYRQRAVLFGGNISPFGMQTPQEGTFFHITTDYGIEISIDGDLSIEKKEAVLKDISKKPIFINSVEFSTTAKYSYPFHTYQVDANGSFFGKIVLPMIYAGSVNGISAIIIEKNAVSKSIDGNTAWLFGIQPYEEITLKINEAIES